MVFHQLVLVSMITKKHIRQYLDKLSPGVASEQVQVSDDVWQKLHEYIVRHYERFDKEARAYADEIFDQLEADVEKRIGSLPQGLEKNELSRKLSAVRGERPPVAVLYLDTPVIENIIRYALGQPSEMDAKALHDEVLPLVKAGKLVWPEDSFHREALQCGGPHALTGLNIVKTLSQSLSFRHTQTIEDFQIFRALRGYIGGNGATDYRKFWQDAFEEETISEIMRKSSTIAFVGVPALAEKLDAVTNQQPGPLSITTPLRIRYDKASLRRDHRLEKQSARHLRDLVRLGTKYQGMIARAQERHLNGFWAGQKLDLPVALWDYLGGKPEGLRGLVSFYESEHFRDVPAIRIKRDIWNALSGQAGGLKRVTGSADINALSSTLPYTDIMILGRKMTTVVRERLKLDSEFNTQVYCMDECDLIMSALKEIARRDTETPASGAATT
jgi:hypothetical protein